MAKVKIITKPRIVTLVTVVIGLIVYSEISGLYAKGRNAVVNTIKGA